MKPLPLLTALVLSCTAYSQQTDTIRFFYKTGQYTLSKQDYTLIDSFLQHSWDRIYINGFTDEVDDTAFNLQLSEKRATEVFRYCIQKKTDSNRLAFRYFGESMPLCDNATAEGRAMNRRTELIGYRYPRITLKPKQAPDPQAPVTTEIDNGVTITYPASFASGGFGDGSFSLVTNTSQMREYNLYNNTTNGEILSSVMIVCPGAINPCQLDKPVLLSVPIKSIPGCGLQKIRFFNSVNIDGKYIWQEQNKTIIPETINGTTYMKVWVDSFCGCINFDIKIPECYDTDSTTILYTSDDFKNFSAELKELNCVYLPKKINDSTAGVMFLKNKPGDALLSFSLYNGKKRIRSYGNQQLSSLPYNEEKGCYLLQSGTIRLSMPDVKLVYMRIKVNNDRYFTRLEDDNTEIKYLHRKNEKITVDFMVDGPGKKLMTFSNQPIESIPVDAVTGQRIISKNYIKQLKEKASYVTRQ